MNKKMISALKPNAGQTHFFTSYELNVKIYFLISTDIQNKTKFDKP